MKKVFKRLLVTVLVLLLVFAVIFVMPSFINKGKTNETGKDWMKQLDGTLRLNQINLPGTHNSAAKFVLGGAFACCQSSTVSEQLEMGVRFLDIRLENTDSGFNLVHALRCLNPKNPFSVLKANTVIDDCLTFLKNHPTETIIFMIKEDKGSTAEKFYDEFYNEFVDDNWYAENKMPSLDEVRGKIVLARRCEIDETKYTDLNSGLNFSVWPDQGDGSTVAYKSFDMELLSKEKANTTINVQDRYRLTPTEKKEAVNFLFSSDVAENSFNINYFSTTYMSFPWTPAKEMNASFRNGEIIFSKNLNGKYAVLFDFISADMAETVYMSNF